ncbi:MAG TPA: glycosyl hydrolase 108 family protein [Candidatus Acidoferrales bacterium]|nr:glycosyl hydrolase 108 family protein [Candidatus Acidoferrales bacterium]
MDFDTAFDRTLGHEGGYTNDPEDPGGETNWGISKRSYPDVDIKNLTRDGAKVIYQRDFWAPVASKLDDALVYQLFDAAVHHGIGNAIRMLQRAVGVADDGYWGPVSQVAYDRMDPNDALLRFLAERLDFMTRLSNWGHNARGWARRIAQNLKYAAADN